MSYLFTHPTSFLAGSDPQIGSACAEVWKHWREAYVYTKPNYPLRRYNNLPEQRKEKKENA